MCIILCTVVVTCSVQDGLDVVTFACWSCFNVNKSTSFGTTFAVGELNNIESNWQFNVRADYKVKQFTCLRRRIKINHEWYILA